MASTSVRPPSGVRLDPSFAETLARGQMKIARLYVSRARIALMRAREARLSGIQGSGAPLTHLERAAHWRRRAREWIAQAAQS